MSATRTDLPAEPFDDVDSGMSDPDISDRPSLAGVASHRATITSANWAPASGTVTALIAVTLTAPR